MKTHPAPTAPRLKTRTICGQRIRLVAGHRYTASRPAGDGKTKHFPITIYPNDAENTPALPGQTLKLPAMSYNDANAFLSAFNNGPTSFDGRLW